MKFILEFILYRRFAGTTAAYEIYQDENSHTDSHFTDQYYHWYFQPTIVTADT